MLSHPDIPGPCMKAAYKSLNFSILYSFPVLVPAFFSHLTNTERTSTTTSLYYGFWVDSYFLSSWLFQFLKCLEPHSWGEGLDSTYLHVFVSVPACVLCPTECHFSMDGASPDTKAWGLWRCSEHRGRESCSSLLPPAGLGVGNILKEKNRFHGVQFFFLPEVKLLT